jgi:mannosylglycoprotein endo-beta-mannosidase
MDDQTFINTKLLLYCFENMSGLRINYQKSEVFVVDVSKEEAVRIAKIFNCNIGKLPLKYLGVMLHNRYMTTDDLAYVAQKVENRIPTCQSVGLSSGGR